MSPSLLRPLLPVTFAFASMLAGCSTTNNSANEGVQGVRALETWRPYLDANPHSRLYVEVDAMEGCEPKEAVLQKFRDFLATHCDKPEGIEIVRSDVIPKRVARGISARTLARSYMNGPRVTNAPAPAFMYVLFYNYRVSEDFPVARAGERGLNKALMRRPRGVPNPYAEVWPYPAIYFNTGYFLGLAETETLLHETGHLLGVASRATNASGLHCADPDCLMTARMRPHRWLIGKIQKRLCEQCLGELEGRRAQPRSSKVRFVDRVLARSEEGYHVISLPDRVALLAGNFSEKACRDFAALAAAEKPAAGQRHQWRVDFLVQDHLLKDRAKLRQLAERIKNDPYDRMRVLGPASLLQTCSQRYRSLGQLTNAVDVLHDAIQVDRKNARSYAALAWIQATCPDASIRNGNEAVTMATKACELSNWTDRRCLEALAAACAETGDFKRAVDLQERALQVTQTSEAEEKAMRKRLYSYEESRPFRDSEGL